MRVLLLCNSSWKLQLQPQLSTSHSSKPPLISNRLSYNNCANWFKKALVGVLSGALSFGLLVIPPTSIAFEASTIQSPSSSSYCLEEEPEHRAESESDSVVRNEGIVEEAWEIVNESFLNVGRHRWSPEDWLVYGHVYTWS